MFMLGLDLTYPGLLFLFDEPQLVTEDLLALDKTEHPCNKFIFP